MPREPRLIDLFGPDKPKRRPFVTHDGTTIARDEALPRSCIGEPLPIAGEPMALDDCPKPKPKVVTFDGARPPLKS